MARVTSCGALCQWNTARSTPAALSASSAPTAAPCGAWITTGRAKRGGGARSPPNPPPPPPLTNPPPRARREGPPPRPPFQVVPGKPPPPQRHEPGMVRDHLLLDLGQLLVGEMGPLRVEAQRGPYGLAVGGDSFERPRIALRVAAHRPDAPDRGLERAGERRPQIGEGGIVQMAVAVDDR